MRIGILFPALAFFLLSFPLATTAGDQDSISTGSLTVDERWIDILQSESHESLSVVEHIFFNNTGLNHFNGTIYAWLPRDAVVSSSCCGNAMDMACRLRDVGMMTCFKIHHTDENIVSGVPFNTSTFLSYFLERGSLTITGRSQNHSYSDSLKIDITLGKGTVWSEYPPVYGEGINLTTNVEEVGVLAETLPNQPERLAVLQPINVTNNGSGNDTIELEISGLPKGWSGFFLIDGKKGQNVSVPSKESRLVLLHLQIPSYIMEIQLEYKIPLKNSRVLRGEYFYEKEFLYNNSAFELYAFLLKGDDLTFDTNLKLVHSQWLEEDERMWYIVDGTNFQAGDATSIKITWENKVDYSSLVLVVAVLVFTGVLVFLFLWRKTRGRARGVEKEELKAEGVYDLSELEARKQKMLMAIRRLKQDFEAGKLPEDVYEELLARYKRNAIEIMKKIDGRK